MKKKCQLDAGGMKLVHALGRFVGVLLFIYLFAFPPLNAQESTCI